MPRYFLGAQMCLSVDLGYLSMPTSDAIGSKRRRDCQNVFFACLKPSSWLVQVPRYVDRPPSRERSTVAREILIWRRCDKTEVFSVPQWSA